MRSNDVLRMSDTHRLSPQTTSSSGYHSDLSSTNQSPQSIHENVSTNNEPPTTFHMEKKFNKSFTRLSTFLRKQYEKAKFKLIPSKQSQPSITTCSKATSTTALFHSSENNHIKSQQPSAVVYKRSSFIEPVYSIYVEPLYDNQIKLPLKTSTSIHESYPHQSSHRLPCLRTNNNNNPINSHSYRRLVSQSNYDNISTGYLLNKSNRNSYIKPRFSQSYYPYKYLSKNLDSIQSTYAPLSDFISSINSAFKPIQSSQHSIPEQIIPSTDPCDLEVAQYFHQTPQWNNRNYFDIYTNQLSLIPPKKTYTETLC